MRRDEVDSWCDMTIFNFLLSRKLYISANELQNASQAVALVNLFWFPPHPLYRNGMQ